MKFSRQEYWSGLPCPPPGDLPDAGIEPGSHALQAGSLPSKPPGKPIWRENSLYLGWSSVQGWFAWGLNELSVLLCQQVCGLDLTLLSLGEWWALSLEHVLCARLCDKHVTWMIPFNLHNNWMRKVPSLLSILQLVRQSQEPLIKPVFVTLP